jgi:ATP-dependent RNA helicase DHX8/PRP22
MTLDTEKLLQDFIECQNVIIPASTYSVEIIYTVKPESDSLDASLITDMNIHLAKLLSDIVIFFTGEEEEATHRS